MKAKKSAGTRDLSAAVETLHQPPTPQRKQDKAGDKKGRASFFEHDDTRQVQLIDGTKVHLTMSRKARLPDYRAGDGKRLHRSLITVPPTVRENILALFGGEDDGSFPWSTALVALADYAAMDLKRNGRRLHVEAAPE